MTSRNLSFALFVLRFILGAVVLGCLAGFVLLGTWAERRADAVDGWIFGNTNPDELLDELRRRGW